MFPVRVEHRLYEQCWSCRLTKKSSITGGYVHIGISLMSCSIGKSTQLTCFLCRVNTYWQSVLALAMDRLIRVSVKNAASCVIYHEFGEVLNAQRRWVFPSARLAQGCLISESVEKFGDTDNTTSSGVLLKVPRSSIFMGQHILRVYTCGCPRMKYDVSYTRLGGMSQMNLFMQPELSRDYPPNLSISFSGGKETN
uniref:ZP domain-containing protein n=1 Tax=Heterorhabditis bacteriophora TaxID=37862 RepID=A0A1I7WDN1_HETBA